MLAAGGCQILRKRLQQLSEVNQKGSLDPHFIRRQHAHPSCWAKNHRLPGRFGIRFRRWCCCKMLLLDFSAAGATCIVRPGHSNSNPDPQALNPTLKS